MPIAIRERFAEPLDFDWQNAAQCNELSRTLVLRAADVQRLAPLCMANMEVAQHRDTKRYAVTRSGTYLPRLTRFEVGDLVYITRQTQGALEPPVYEEILQIIGFEESGNARLQGKDGTTINMSLSRLAPCHLAWMGQTSKTATATAGYNGDGAQKLQLVAVLVGYRLCGQLPGRPRRPRVATGRYPRGCLCDTPLIQWDHTVGPVFYVIC